MCSDDPGVCCHVSGGHWLEQAMSVTAQQHPSHDEEQSPLTQPDSAGAAGSVQRQAKLEPESVDIGILLAFARALERCRCWRRLAGRTIFVVLFVASTVVVRRFGEAIAIRGAVKQHFSMTPFPLSGYMTKFAEIQSVEAIRPWLEVVLLPAVLWQADAPAQRFHSVDCQLKLQGLVSGSQGACAHAYIRGSHRIISPVRFRQVAVQMSRCGPREDEPCWPPFSPNNARTDGLCTSIGSYSCRYSEALPRLIGLPGHGADYGRGGYVLSIPLDRSWRAAYEANLGTSAEGPPWLPEGVRAFSVEFALHTGHIDLVTFVRFLFDISPGGRVQPSLQTWSLQARPYSEFADSSALAVDVVLWVCLLVYVTLIACNIIMHRWAYMCQVCSWLEIGNCFLHLWAAFRWVAYVAADRDVLLHDKSLEKDQFPDAEYLISLSQGLPQAAAINIVFACFAIVLDLKAFSTFARLWAVLRRSTAVLAPLACAFVLSTLGFAVMGHWFFGPQVRGFNTLPHSVFSLMMSLFESLDFSSLKDVEPHAALIYMAGWVLISLLGLTSLFTAIIAEAFEYKQNQERMQHVASSRDELCAAIAVPRSRSTACLFGKADCIPQVCGQAQFCLRMETDSELLHDVHMVRRAATLLAVHTPSLAALDVSWDAGLRTLSLEESMEFLIVPRKRFGGCMRDFEEEVGELRRLAAALRRLGDAATSAVAAETTTANIDLNVGKPEHESTVGGAAGTSNVGSTLAQNSEKEATWTEEVDDDVAEALNMLRFEVHALSQAVSGLEECPVSTVISGTGERQHDAASEPASARSIIDVDQAVHSPSLATRIPRIQFIPAESEPSESEPTHQSTPSASQALLGRPAVGHSSVPSVVTGLPMPWVPAERVVKEESPRNRSRLEVDSMDLDVLVCTEKQVTDSSMEPVSDEGRGSDLSQDSSLLLGNSPTSVAAEDFVTMESPSREKTGDSAQAGARTPLEMEAIVASGDFCLLSNGRLRM